MSIAAIQEVLRQLGPPISSVSDADLMDNFVARKDADAFAEIVARHGPMVAGACRRILGDAHDAEDALQAVFLVLAQKAATVNPAGAVGGWLYGVAVRTANKARTTATRRRRREMIAAARETRSNDPSVSTEHGELCSVLDQELARLPHALRDAIVLCELQGKTRAEAAADLRCPEGTIAARLHRGRKKLASALARRGLALPAAGLATVLAPAAISAGSLQCAIGAALGLSASAAALALARGVIRSMAYTTHIIAVGMVSLIAGGALFAGSFMTPDAVNPAEKPAVAQTPDRDGEAPHLPVARTDEKGGGSIAHWREAGSLEGVNDYVDSLAFSLDGKLVAMGSLGGKAGNTVAMWDAATWKKLWKQGLSSPGFTAVSFSPDGKLVAATGDQETRFYEAPTGKVYPLKQPFPGGKAVAFSPDGKWVGFSDSYSSGFQALEIHGGHASTKSGKELEQRKEFEQLIKVWPAAVAWSPDSLYLAYAMATGPDRDWYVGMLGVTPETKPRNLAGHKGKVTSLAWSRDGKFLAAGGEDGKVLIWDGKAFAEIPPRRIDLGGRDGTSTIHSLAFTHDSRMLAAAVEFNDGKNAFRVALLDPATGERTQNDLQFFWKSPPMTVAFSPNGKTLLVGCGYCDPQHRKLPDEERAKAAEVRVFTSEPEQLKVNPGVAPAPAAVIPQWKEKKVRDATDSIFSVAYDPKGNTFAAGCARGDVTNWQAADLTIFRRLNYSMSQGMALPAMIAYSPDGRYFAQTCRGGSLLIDTTTWKSVFNKKLADGEQAELLIGQDSPLALAFAPTEEIDGRKLNRLATTDGRSVTATTWIDGGPPSTAKFGPLAGAPKIDGVPPAGVAYSPDGKQLVFIPNYKMSPDGAVGKPDPEKATHWIAQVWGGGSGARMAFLVHGTSPVTAVAWSHEGNLIATGDATGEVVLWDAKTFKQVRRITTVGQCNVHALAFTHDGKTLAAAATWDEGRNVHRVVFLDCASGERIADIRDLRMPPLAIAFSPDDNTLLVGCGDPDAGGKKRTEEEMKKLGELHVFTR